MLPENDGWFLTKRGWPDYLIVSPDGKLSLVEVKNGHGAISGLYHQLKPEQIFVLALLQRKGFDVNLSDGKRGLVRFDAERALRKRGSPKTEPRRQQFREMLDRIKF